MKIIPCKVVNEKQDDGSFANTIYPASPIPYEGALRVVFDGANNQYLVFTDPTEEKQYINSIPTLKECVDAQTATKSADVQVIP